MVIGIALLSAFFYALASALQHHSASLAPREDLLSPTLLGVLARKPIWLLGIASDLVGFTCQFLALAHGPISEVQPILVCGLLFALPMGAYISKRRFSKSDLLGAGFVVSGLIIFLQAARPGPGKPASSTAWLATAVICATPVIAVVILVKLGTLPKKFHSGVLAGSAGIAFGFGAGLADSCAHELSRMGFVNTLETWEPYSLLVVGLVTLLLAQSAFQAGKLSDSLPILTVVDPLVSVLIGVLLFRESIGHSTLAILLEVVGMILMVTGIMIDGRSLLVTGFDEST